MSDVTEARSDAASRLIIPNRLDALRPMSEWLDESIRAGGLPEALAFKFDLCANEAVTNIISYAYTDGAPHDISLRLFREGGAVSLEIVDDGVAFNPLQRPQHAAPARLEDADVGGLGVDLIRSFMSECRYVRRDGRNVLTLTADIEG